MITCHAAIAKSQSVIKAQISLIDAKFRLLKLPTDPPKSASAGRLLALMVNEAESLKSAPQVFHAVTKIKHDVMAARLEASKILSDARKAANHWIDVADYLAGNGSLPADIPEQISTLARKTAIAIKSGAITSPSDELKRYAIHALSAVAEAEDKLQFLKDTASYVLNINREKLYATLAEHKSFGAAERKQFANFVYRADLAKSAYRKHLYERKQALRKAAHTND